jgi:hypothetical protein
MKFKFRLLDWCVAILLLGYGLVQGGISLLLSIIAFLLYLLVRFRFGTDKNAPMLTKGEFVVEQNNNEKYVSNAVLYLDVNFNRRPLAGHFLMDSRFETNFTKSLYEYRIENTEVLYRLIEDLHEDIGEKRQDVRDGVVQETAFREHYNGKSYSGSYVDERIQELKAQVEWRNLVSWGFNGAKYFILAKKLPKPDARRFFRQELERLRQGTAAFFKEAEKYGLEPDESSPDRLRVANGRTEPSSDEWKKLNESAPSFGIDCLEFSWGKNLTGQLEKLLGD